MRTKEENHQHYTTASLKERLLFKSFADKHPNLITNVTYSPVEGYDNWDVMFTYSSETTQRLAEIKVRNSSSTYSGYTIQKDKYDKLMQSAFTYTLTYINFFDDNNLLMWDLNNQPTPNFDYHLYQENNLDNKPKTKVAADLPMTAATRYQNTYTITEASKKAEIVYQERLQPSHQKKWKMI